MNNKIVYTIDVISDVLGKEINLSTANMEFEYYSEEHKNEICKRLIKNIGNTDEYAIIFIMQRFRELKIIALQKEFKQE